MKKTIVLIVFLISTAGFADLYIDGFGHYSRQVNPTAVNMAGYDIGIAYKVMPELAIDTFFIADRYNITYSSASTYTFRDYTFGGGARYYVMPELYIRAIFGRLMEKYSIDGAASISENELMYGGGIAYLLDIIPGIFLNLGVNYYRYLTSKASRIYIHTGITVELL